MDWRAGEQAALEGVFGEPIGDRRRLSGGCVGDVWWVQSAGGQQVVVKRGGRALDKEGRMLEYLAEVGGVAVPEVFHQAPELLVMEYVEADGRRSPRGEEEVAEALLALHSVGAKAHGFEEDTLIGGLALSNEWMADWRRFFGEQRLLDMGLRAMEAGQMGKSLMKRVEAVVDDLEELIEEPQEPGLLHGDIWSGNLLFHQGRLAALIDPAIYYGDPEIELAFIGLFNTLGEAFYERYGADRPIDEGFFEVRRDVYNLFPLLVHIRLFGGSYVGQCQSTLSRIGY